MSCDDGTASGGKENKETQQNPLPPTAGFEADGVGCPAKKALVPVLLFLVVFLAGGATGAVLMRTLGKPERPAGRQFRPEEPGAFEQKIAAGIAAKYGLPPQEEQKILAIVRANGEKLWTLRKEYFPKMQACWTEMNQKIRAVLPEERRGEFDRELQEKQRQIFSGDDRRRREDGRHERDNRRMGPDNMPRAPQDGGSLRQPARPVPSAPQPAQE